VDLQVRGEPVKNYPTKSFLAWKGKTGGRLSGSFLIAQVNTTKIVSF
jgi:hypothetical protein